MSKYRNPETGQIIEIDDSQGEPTEEILDSMSSFQDEVKVKEEHGNVLKEKLRTSDVVFPRTARAINQGDSYFKQMLGTALDIFSGLLTAPVAAGRTLDTQMGWSGEKPQSYLESYKQIIEGKNPDNESSFVSEMVSDPSTVPAMMTGATGAKWILKGGKWVPRILKSATIGAGEGSLAATIHQAENVAEGKEISPKEAAIEIGSSALLNTLIPVVGETFKKAGTKFFTAGAKALEQKGALKKGANIENLFKHKVAGGLDKSLSNVEDRISKLGDELLTKVKGKKVDVNLNEIFEKTEGEILERVEKGELTGQNKQMLKALDDLREELKLSVPEGIANTEKLLAIKRAWGKLGKFVRDAPPELSAKQDVANALTKNFNEKLLELVPGAKKINKELSELIPLKQPLKEAAAQAKRNDAISMGDMLLFIATGGAGAAGGGSAGAAGGVGLTAALIAARRLSKSPAFGSQLRKAGENIIEQQAVSPIINQMGRTKLRENSDTDNDPLGIR